MIWTILVFVLAAVLFIIGVIESRRYWKLEDKFDNLRCTFSAVGYIMGAFCTAVEIVMIIVIICSNANTEAQVAQQNEARSSYIFQLENETYLNDNNVGTMELFEDIKEFNESIVGGRASRQNPWVNWFYGKWCEEVEPIDLSEY